MSTSSDLVPAGTWDCHFHIFDPANFPYKATRTYTPEEAKIEQFVHQTLATNFLLVQSSNEDGMAGVISHLRRANKEYPNSIWRAEIHVDEDYSDEQLKEMHELGVRAIRLHGEIGVPLENRTEILKKEFTRVGKVAKKMGWFVSSLSSLQSWLELGSWLVEDPVMKDVKIIVEHSGRPDPNRKIEEYAEYDKFVKFLAAHPKQFWVKICGINRLETAADPPGNIRAIPEAVVKLAKELQEDNIVWGSDWPHVRSHGVARLEVGKNKEVDIQNELTLLKKVVPATLWTKMMVENPARLFK